MTKLKPSNSSFSPNLFSLSQAAFKQLWRDFKSGELFLLCLCLIVAISASTCISFFAERIDHALTEQANELLAADLRISSRQTIDQSVANQARALNFETAEFRSFQGIVRNKEAFGLAEIKAVSKNYPLRGHLETQTHLDANAIVEPSLPQLGEVWLDPVLMVQLNLQLNDFINIGEASFKVSKIISYEPDRGGDLFNTSPRALINLQDIDATKLLGAGSRSEFVSLFKTENKAALDDFSDKIKAEDSNNALQIQTIKSRQPTIKIALERGERFMKMAAFISLALSCCGIALSAHRFAQKSWDHVAILNALGMQKKNIFILLGLELSFLGIFAAILGSLVGFLTQFFLTQLLEGIIVNFALPAPSLKPILTSIILSLVATLGFALPSIMALKHVSPMNVLRRNTSSFTDSQTFKSKLLRYGFTTVLLCLLGLWQVNNLILSFWLLTSLALALLVFWACSILSLKLLPILGKKFKLLLWIEKQLLHHRQNSLLQITTVAFASCILMMMLIVKTDLLNAWALSVPQNAPNHFAFNIPSNEINELSSYLKTNEVKDFKLYPMVRGRISAHNQEKLNIDNLKSEEEKRFARREYSFSWTQSLPKANTLVAGEFPPKISNGKIGISVEDELAKRLGYKLNDEITFTLQGQKISAVITSLRKIAWESAEVNFFILFPENVLTDYPQTWITAFHWTKPKSELIKMVEKFPAITLVDVGDVMQKVRQLIDRVTFAITAILIFTLLAGLLVLIIAIQSTLETRAKEIALFKTFGVQKELIWKMISLEFFSIGLLGGLLASVLAFLIGSVIIWGLFDLISAPNIIQLFLGAILTMLFVGISGLWICYKVMRTTPIEILRQNE